MCKLVWWIEEKSWKERFCWIKSWCWNFFQEHYVNADLVFINGCVLKSHNDKLIKFFMKSIADWLEEFMIPDEKMIDWYIGMKKEKLEGRKFTFPHPKNPLSNNSYRGNIKWKVVTVQFYDAFRTAHVWTSAYVWTYWWCCTNMQYSMQWKSSN